MAHFTGYFNEHTYETDLVSQAPQGVPPSKAKKKRTKVTYCTSMSCTRPEKLKHKQGYAYDKFRVIDKPPDDGWCPHCKNALFTCYEIIS